MRSAQAIQWAGMTKKQQIQILLKASMDWSLSGTESIASGETRQSVSAMRFVPEGDAGQRTGCTGEREDPIFCFPFRDGNSGQFMIVGILPTLIATSLTGIGWRIARQSKSLIGVVSHP